MKNRYVFYFPYRGFGGVPILFLRVAKALTSLGYPCSVIDYPDGYMAKNKAEGIEFISCEQESIEIADQYILVFQSDLPWGIPKNINTHPDTTVFFWNCYPFNLIPVPPAPLNHYVSSRLLLVKLLLLTLMRSARKKTLLFLQDLVRHDALAFMDEANRQTSEYALSYSPIPNRFLPVLVNERNEAKARELLHPDTMTIAWVGRVADFKIHSLYRVIEDLTAINTKLKFKMLIVGDGRFLPELKSFCSKINQIEFEFIPSVPSAEIPQFLNSRVDLLCAMGTAALEGGLSQVPTILLDFSYKHIPSGYQYRFLHQTDFFNLGSPIGSQHLGDKSNLKQLLDLVVENKTNIANQCYNYVLHNHSIEKKLNYFVKLSQDSSFKYNDLKKQNYLQKPWLYRFRAKILSLLKEFSL